MTQKADLFEEFTHSTKNSHASAISRQHSTPKERQEKTKYDKVTERIPGV